MTEIRRNPIFPDIPESFQGDQRKWAEGMLDFLKKHIHGDYDDFVDHSTRHEDGGDDEISVAALSGELADDQLVKTSDAVSKLFCRIKTGTYTGDGSTGQAITGVGFQPKHVKIWPHPTVDDNAEEIHEKLDQSWGDYAYVHSGTFPHHIRDNRINSLDADGFTVDESGWYQIKWPDVTTRVKFEKGEGIAIPVGQCKSGAYYTHLGIIRDTSGMEIKAVDNGENPYYGPLFSIV